MIDLEEGSGTEDSDTELLEKICCYKNETPEEGKRYGKTFKVLIHVDKYCLILLI